MQIRFLLGPAGSGKTHRCLAEIREALLAAPEGPPLILLAPKQATFQLERQLLAEDPLQGYTRLRIFSFERLAQFILRELHQPPPKMLDEEGRLMVLRALLARRRDDLKLFRASARLAGFAGQLSLALREFQRNLLTPEVLFELSEVSRQPPALAHKLHDFATILHDYQNWLSGGGLQDADSLINAAVMAAGGQFKNQNSRFKIERIWLDGFAEFSAQELDLLAAVTPHCERATIALCLDREPPQKVSWLSNWSFIARAFEECRHRLAEICGVKIEVEQISRDLQKNRFARNPVFTHLEKFWDDPAAPVLRSSAATDSSWPIRLVIGANPEAEAEMAAREVLRFVRAGGRFREAAVIVRSLENYHHVLQRAFQRFEIPCFVDRREPVAHHPLAELTRSALRLAAFNWQHDDWFAALKTGLVTEDEFEIDRLENEALARGWKGAAWFEPIEITSDAALSGSLEKLRLKLIGPFEKFNAALAGTKRRPTGAQLAEALREFWHALAVEETLEAWSSARATPNAIHATVWEQMNLWLENLARAFPAGAQPLRDWLPILETGLGSLTVGVIPPALDQVLIGSVDRSRNPDIKLAIVPGLNEGEFPAPPQSAPLLTDADREELERRGTDLGGNPRRQISRERFFGYIACTRARERLVLSCSAADMEGRTLNPSPIIERARKLFAGLRMENFPGETDWRKAGTPRELIAPLIKIKAANWKMPAWERIETLPPVAAALGQLRHTLSATDDRLSTGLAEKLYGPTLRTSVSRLEQFAACPFKFFVHSGLRAEERRVFELDVREQGSFQHEVLKEFHEQLGRESKRWRDISAREARERVANISEALVVNYREGLLQASDETRFTARVLTESLQDFVETLVGWMHSQYQFDPVAVELDFGEPATNPPWTLELDAAHRLSLRGRIDRVDLWRETNSGTALCVVIDYKSSRKKLDALLVGNGLQLQLLAYLNVLRRWPEPEKIFGAKRLVPAGAFYVNLRGKFEPAENRRSALGEISEARKRAYQHFGRFDARALARLDARLAATGDQFNFKKNQDGSLSKISREAMSSEEFLALLDSVEANLRRMGREIFSGAAAVAPFRKGAATACDQCDYQGICRIDPWTHEFRSLKKIPEGAEP